MGTSTEVAATSVHKGRHLLVLRLNVRKDIDKKGCIAEVAVVDLTSVGYGKLQPRIGRHRTHGLSYTEVGEDILGPSEQRIERDCAVVLIAKER